MVDIKNRKSFMTVSIFVPNEDINVIKEINEFAKTDIRIDKDKAKSSKNLVSLLTRTLWKSYIFKRKQERQNESS